MESSRHISLKPGSIEWEDSINVTQAADTSEKLRRGDNPRRRLRRGTSHGCALVGWEAGIVLVGVILISTFPKNFT
jgi:hypothetical protein